MSRPVGARALGEAPRAAGQRRIGERRDPDLVIKIVITLLIRDNGINKSTTSNQNIDNNHST